jgi:hypothetical protein
LGGLPADQGVDFVRLLNHYNTHAPRSSKDRPHLPNHFVNTGFKIQLERAILSVSPAKIFKYLLWQHPLSFFNSSGWRALRQLRQVREDARREHPGPLPLVGYRPGYLQLLSGPIRERLRIILAEQFEPEADSLYAVPLANLLTAIAWVTQPMVELKKD